MKNLNQYLRESILDDEDVIISQTHVDLIYNFIEKHYNVKMDKIDIQEKNGEYFVTVFNSIYVKNDISRELKSLTNGLFKFERVIDVFDIEGCEKLESLEGAPSQAGIFQCGKCTKLKSLEGAPERCGIFDCSGCKSLKSLQGMPQNIVYDCNFSGCNKIKDLKYLPNKVGGDVIAPKQFDVNDIKKVCKVAGDIIIK